MDEFLNKFHIPILILIIIISIFLRMYKVTQVPPGLYMDEVAIGVDAKSILQSGRDQYGVKLPLYFRSLNDYKLPIYIYSTSLAFLIFGANDFGVRFVSIFCSILSVLVFYLILKKILELDHLENHKYIKFIPLVSAFLLAISNWHIHFSRAGFEIIPALFLYLLSFYLALLSIKNKKFIILSLMFLSLTMYTYHSYKVIAPLTLLFYLHLWFTKKDYKKIILIGVLFFVLISPIFVNSFTKDGSARFSQTNTFSKFGNISPIEKIYTYPSVFMDNYISYFSSMFLFVEGDNYGRHLVPGFGVILKWQIPFIILGIYLLIGLKRSIFKKITLFLLFVSPIAASLALPSPHALRSLTMVIPLVIICALGVSRILVIKNKIILGLFLIIFIFGIYEYSYYFHFYYYHYPKVKIIDWGGENKQVTDEASKFKDYKHIVIDHNLNYLDSYFKFYHPELKIQMVDKDWIKPKAWGEEKVLYLRPYYGSHQSKTVKVIRLKNQNSDIFAEFFSL